MNQRIKTLASLIPPYTRIADVGCDHGYLIEEAFKSAHISFAQAIDNKTEPLQSAKRNLSGYHPKVIFSLSNGLDDLDPNVQVVVIAGMGGSLIVEILSHPTQWAQVKRFIIQANKNGEKVRQFAQTNDLYIVYETMIEERGIFYEIIVLERGYKLYSDHEIVFGPYLLQDKSPIFIQKWLKVYRKNKSITSKKAKLMCELIQKYILNEVSE